MTRDEAFHVLEVTDGAEPDAIRRAYEAKAVANTRGASPRPQHPGSASRTRTKPSVSARPATCC